MSCCDGCGRNKTTDVDMQVHRIQLLLEERFGSCEEDLPMELDQCADCGWGVCEVCAGDPVKSTCRCPASNMGTAYADMQGPQSHMGEAGGARYTGPFKCEAQRKMERRLMLLRADGHKPYLTECCAGDCGKTLMPTEAKLCSRCRSVVYCSPECQAKAWITPHGGHGAHKESCGAYLPPDAWPYISRLCLEYREHWGRYPTAKLTAEQHANDAALLLLEEEESREVDVARRTYLAARDCMLVEAGFGELVENRRAET